LSPLASVGKTTAFAHFSGNLNQTLRACSSGRELLDRGFPEDIDDAACLDVSHAVPILHNKCFRDFDQGA
jgi:2-phosphosulfolactate phosphatase